MKIVVTGSLGHIGRPLTEQLIQKGHAVTVVSSSAERRGEIEKLGASAAIGTLKDVKFLANTFQDADLVYCMIPPDYRQASQHGYYREVGTNYAEAINLSGVTRAIHLSSYGADLDKGTGIILGSHFVENMLNKLKGVAVTHMRPGFFYYNLLNFIPMIKQAGFIASNYGGDDRMVMVSPLDIADAILKEIESHQPDSSQAKYYAGTRIDIPATTSNVRYVASDELTASEVARVLGDAIGKPGMEWKVISGEQVQGALTANGVPADFAANLVELNSAIHSGEMLKGYEANRPALGKVKLADFAMDFAAAFGQK